MKINAPIDRRDFLRTAAALTAGALFTDKPSHAQPEPDADRWRRIAGQYTPSPHLLNLNNAGVSPQPRIVQEAMISAYRFANE